MSEYGYKVLMRSAECGAVRAVAFHDEDFMEFHEASIEASKRMSSQYCARCDERHDSNTFHAQDMERGEPDQNGELVWRNAYPTRVDEYFNPEVFYG